MLFLRCLNCNEVFKKNLDGESDIGIKRPMCPECGEEIDIVNAQRCTSCGEVIDQESESRYCESCVEMLGVEDSTGYPY